MKLNWKGSDCVRAEQAGVCIYVSYAVDTVGLLWSWRLTVVKEKELRFLLSGNEQRRANHEAERGPKWHSKRAIFHHFQSTVSRKHDTVRDQRVALFMHKPFGFATTHHFHVVTTALQPKDTIQLSMVEKIALTRNASVNSTYLLAMAQLPNIAELLRSVRVTTSLQSISL